MKFSIKDFFSKCDQIRKKLEQDVHISNKKEYSSDKKINLQLIRLFHYINTFT